MVTALQIHEAEKEAQRQRLRNGRLLAINKADATTDELALAQKVIATVQADDGAGFDRALASRNVGELFNRGTLYFARGASR